ncbi:cytochrome c-type biogenesis protein [Ponticaulis profundi]|uniref:Cytochrome c-type biogenesis protein n=1 Tax=Ponticaulis profundi TaxID=2665222 RepID=A0ABW1S752_9PROT
MSRLFQALAMTACLFCAAPALAQSDPQLSDEAVKERTETISKTLRCVICQNQSIADSNSTLAEDMRNLVERRVRLGDSDEEVRDYMQARYGDFVLMKPPVQWNTYLLWFGPLLLVGLGGIWYILTLRSAQKAQAAKAGDDELSAEEEARLAALLSDTSDESPKS